MKECIVCHKPIIKDSDNYCRFCGAHTDAVLVKESRVDDDAVSITYKVGEETWRMNGVISEGVFQKKLIA